MNTTRLMRNVSAGVVAGIAAWSSYRHMVTVALSVGEQPEIAWVLPLSVDGMLVVASVAMVDDRRSGRAVRWSARVAFGVGVLASIAANIAAAHPTLGARIVSAWPALALLLTVELLSRSGRKKAEIRHVRAESKPATERQVSRARTRKPTRRPQALSQQLLRELLADDPTLSPEALGKTMRISPRRVRQLLAAE